MIGDQEGMAITLITRNESPFAAKLVKSLELSGQIISPELLDLAMGDSKFREERSRGEFPPLTSSYSIFVFFCLLLRLFSSSSSSLQKLQIVDFPSLFFNHLDVSANSVPIGSGSQNSLGMSQSMSGGRGRGTGRGRGRGARGRLDMSRSMVNEMKIAATKTSGASVNETMKNQMMMQFKSAFKKASTGDSFQQTKNVLPVPPGPPPGPPPALPPGPPPGLPSDTSSNSTTSQKRKRSRWDSGPESQA